jgi:nucleoside-diphosphate-sugar epimerase
MSDQHQSSGVITHKPVALVAGGAGFIGSFLCQSLLLQGCQVICVDNLLTGKKENLASCLNNPNFKFQNQDLTRPLKNISKVDYIFHLAGMEGNRRSSLKHLLVNSEGTKNLLDLAKEFSAKFLLGSSEGIFSDTQAVKSLKKPWKKGKLLNGHNEAKRFAEELTREYFSRNVDIRIVRLGWVYGPRMNLDSDREIARLFKSAFQSSFIEVPGAGDQEIYPTFISDAIYGLTKAIFTSQTNGEIFTLVGTEKTTFFALAQDIRKLLAKKLEIKFISQEREPIVLDNSIRESQEKLGWKAKTGLYEGIEKTTAFFSLSKKPRKVKKTPPRSKIGLGLIVAFALIVFLFLPFYLPFLHLLFGAQNLKKAYQNIQKGELVSFEKKTARALDNFEKAEKRLDQLKGLFFFLGIDAKRQELNLTINSVKKVTKTGLDFAHFAQIAEEISQIILQKKSGDLVQATSELELLLSSLWRKTSFLEANLKDYSFLFSNKFLKVPLTESEIKSHLKEARKMLVALRSFLPILPEVVGASGEKTYLVLLQNNMELRPTGGFIGSFALVNFDKGQLSKFDVFDVYSADGQLKGHVEPPEPLKAHLGEGGWYLRDSNWDPNFPTSALRAQWFLEKTLGQKTDGVVALNLNLPQKMLASLGEIELPDFKEKVNHQDLFQKAEKYSQEGFFPGSTQKGDFLGSLSRALLEKVKDAPASEHFKVIQAIYSSFQEKDLAIYLNEVRLMKTINALGWEGSIRQLTCQNTDVVCFKDYLMIVEANLGVNKANFYLKRKISFQTDIQKENRFSSNLKIHFQNESFKNSRFGGDYKNYLRVYVPLGSNLDQVKIGSQILSEEEIDLGIASGKTYFGFLVNVETGKTKSVEISYRPPFKIKKGKTIDYLLLWQRQSGSDPSQISFSFNPGPASIIKTSLPSEAKLDRDLSFQSRLEF